MNVQVGDQVAFIKLDTGQYLITKSHSVKNFIMVDPKPEYLSNKENSSKKREDTSEWQREFVCYLMKYKKRHFGVVYDSSSMRMENA
ncbi:hypothetical protein AMS62_05995 [Bacillus sp. FJAT-18019]|nr:hypothetical protein AMS62_05995 [Bacillus sp. FJAT-18019]